MLSNLILPGEVHPRPAGELSRKAAAPLVEGARNEPESRVLRALRRAPAASEFELARSTGLPEPVTRAAVQALADRHEGRNPRDRSQDAAD